MLSYDECGSSKLSPTVILRDIKTPKTQLNNERNFITTPSTPAGNNGFDNINGDLICYENQEIVDTEGRRFCLKKWVGQGHFGQVYECTYANYQSFQSSFSKSFANAEIKNEKKRYAIKISKSSSEALAQFNYESDALFYLKNRLNRESQKNVSIIEYSFIFMNHFCLVFELMGPSIFDELKNNMYNGLSLSYIQNVLKCVLPVLSDLSSLGLMHCDVKPENILCSIDQKQFQTSNRSSIDYPNPLFEYPSRHFSNESKSYDNLQNSKLLIQNCSPKFKLIDFGSCMFYDSNKCFYLQSRYYRAPEVILQIPFDSKVDIWSLGCVAAELFLGLPLLPAQNDIHLAQLIEKTIGKFPESMRDITSRKPMLFNPNGNIKPLDELIRINGCEDFTANWKPYFMKEKLEDILNSYESQNPEDNGRNRELFIDLLKKMLTVDPDERITADEALDHLFFDIDFQV